jgi:predicted nucleic acid-binding protein
VRSYLESQPEEIEYVTTTINLREIAVGRKLVDEFDPVEIRSQFEWVRVVPVTPVIAWGIAEIETRLHRADDVNRDQIDALASDAITAGAASELDATVITIDIKDFRTLGVPAETYV